MSNQLNNTLSSYIGDLQQTVGEKIGNPDLAATGAAQKSQAEAAQAAANAEAKVQSDGRILLGRTQQKIGSETGDIGMQLKGVANQALGDIENKLREDNKNKDSSNSSSSHSNINNSSSSSDNNNNSSSSSGNSSTNDNH